MSAPKGITLIETVVYIGLFMVVLPAYVLFLLQVWQTNTSLDERSRMEQTGALVFLELQNGITEAQAINVSTSTLSNDAGVLRFVDSTGQIVTIDRPTVSVTFSGVPTNVNRLRMQKGSSPAVYLTDPEINVTEWRIEAVRDGSDLSGLRFNLDFAMLNPGTGAYRQSAFTGDTTLSLSAPTVEN